MAREILDFSTKEVQILTLLDTLMQDIYMIPIMIDHKKALCFYTMKQSFHESHLNKFW
jgi:hypothetical protein